MDHKLKIHYYNEVFVKLDAEYQILKKIQDNFMFMIPNAKWNPRVRNGIWDGYIRLFNMRDNTIYVGLIPEIIRFCREENIEIVDYRDIKNDINISNEDVMDFSKEIKCIYEPYPDQIDIISSCINEKRKTVISPTGSGKTLMIYLVAKYLVEKLGMKVLILVPTILLRKQTSNDFKEYNNGGDDDLYVIKSGKEAEGGLDKNIYFSVFKTLVKCTSEWINQFDCIIGDEAHHFPAKTFKELLEKSTQVKYKIGMTATLQDTKSDKFIIKGLFGDDISLKNTRELINEGRLSVLNDIQMVEFDYSDRIKKEFKEYLKEYSKECKKSNKKPMLYKAEIDFISNLPERNKMLEKMVNHMKGNILVSFRFIDHGKKLHEDYFSKNKNKQCYFISGKYNTPEEQGENINDLMDKLENICLTASIGVFSTGISINSINNILISSPIKGKIKLKQLIGRGLRNDGNKLTIYDIYDNLSYKKNFSKEHAKERVKLYQEENHPIKHRSIKIN